MDIQQLAKDASLLDSMLDVGLGCAMVAGKANRADVAAAHDAFARLMAALNDAARRQAELAAQEAANKAAGANEKTGDAGSESPAPAAAVPKE